MSKLILIALAIFGAQIANGKVDGYVRTPFKDMNTCQAANQSTECEKIGNFYFPECREGFKSTPKGECLKK